MSTVLQVIQRAMLRVQLPSPTTANGNTDVNVSLMMAMLNQTLQDISRDFPWPELQKEHFITLVDGQASYPLPSDFDLFLTETMWNRDSRWPLIGPITPTVWQQYKSGIVTTLPRQRLRVKGWTNNQIFFDPTPDADDAGQLCVFEYISKTTIAPRTWVASTSWVENAECSFNGNIYTRGSTGAATTGTTAPTHTSGTVSDGSILWTYTNAAHDATTVNSNDTDQILLDDRIIEDGTVWRFKQERGLDFEDIRAQAMKALDLSKSRLIGAGILDLRIANTLPNTIGLWSYPDGNFQV